MIGRGSAYWLRYAGRCGRGLTARLERRGGTLQLSPGPGRFFSPRWDAAPAWPGGPHTNVHVRKKSMFFVIVVLNVYKNKKLHEKKHIKTPQCHNVPRWVFSG